VFVESIFFLIFLVLRLSFLYFFFFSVAPAFSHVVPSDDLVAGRLNNYWTWRVLPCDTISKRAVSNDARVNHHGPHVEESRQSPHLSLGETISPRTAGGFGRRVRHGIATSDYEHL